MNLKTLLHFILFCSFNTVICVHAQNDSASSPRITIKSFIQEGDSTKEATSIINFQDRNQVAHFLDSILGSTGKTIQSVQKQLKELNISEQDILSLDSIFSKLSGKFNQAFGAYPQSKDKVVLGVMIDDYNNTNDLKILHPIISSIIPNSPAEKAGLKKNDIIFKLDGEEVNILPDMISIIKNRTDGDSLHIIFIREKDTLNTIAVLKVMPKEENWLTLLQNQMDAIDSCALKAHNPFCEKIIVQQSGPRLGVKVTDLNAEARKDLKAKNGGALVTQVLPNSTAEDMQLQLNDVITSINGIEIQNVAELKAILAGLAVPHEIVITYTRYGKKKKSKGTIHEFSKAWDDNKLMNIIDLSNFFKE